MRLCVGADYYLNDSNVPIYPPVCCPAALIALHMKKQGCVCNPSSIGPHLLTLEMADLKSDSHAECFCVFYMCVCAGEWSGVE